MKRKKSAAISISDHSLAQCVWHTASLLSDQRLRMMVLSIGSHKARGKIIEMIRIRDQTSEKQVRNPFRVKDSQVCSNEFSTICHRDVWVHCNSNLEFILPIYRFTTAYSQSRMSWSFSQLSLNKKAGNTQSCAGKFKVFRGCYGPRISCETSEIYIIFVHRERKTTIPWTHSDYPYLMSVNDTRRSIDPSTYQDTPITNTFAVYVFKRCFTYKRFGHWYGLMLPRVHKGLLLHRQILNPSFRRFKTAHFSETSSVMLPQIAREHGHACHQACGTHARAWQTELSRRQQERGVCRYHFREDKQC